MADNYQALLVGSAAVITAVGTIWIGVKNGNNTRAKDHAEARNVLEDAQEKRDIAVEQATVARIEALAADATAARKRARDIEEEVYSRLDNARREYDKLVKEKEQVRRWGQRGWDLAAHYFGIVGVLDHLLLNIFQVHETVGPLINNPLYEIISNARIRMGKMKIPILLESPLEDGDTKAE